MRGNIKSVGVVVGILVDLKVEDNDFFFLGFFIEGIWVKWGDLVEDMRFEESR